MRGHSVKAAIYKPERQSSPEINPGGTLMLDPNLQNCEKTNVCCLSRPAGAVLYGSLSVWELRFWEGFPPLSK